MILPDQCHIEHLREALWSGREHGRVAVMVGAGFSVNATPKRQPPIPFPSWGKLVERLATELYGPVDSVPGQPRQQTHSIRDALRLAQEFEVAFGREALDALLLRAIPDGDYDPGDLHLRLLKLPWADVLTTNYDTLLERAAELTPDRRYAVVRTPQEIPLATKPRIMKLHGSFPATRPFIVTEDDFRTYPSEFAPFVNSAQQVLMEHKLLMIGFSGDDPNFLHWTGWVRDHLGKAAPRIFMAGVLNLTDAQRRLFEQRRITPIDLSPLVSTAICPDPVERHRRCLEWLLAAMEDAEPPNPLRWPMHDPRPSPHKSPTTPDLPKAERREPSEEPVSPKSGADLTEEIRAVARTWRRNRDLYPGWLITPHQNREALWSRTFWWVNPIAGSANALAPADRLTILGELNWRLERCLTPLFPELTEVITQAIDDVEAFPDVAPQPQASLRPGGTGESGRDWPQLRWAWETLCLARLRRSRESQNRAEFEQDVKRLAPLAEARPGAAAALHYEQALYALYCLDRRQARSVLEGWDVTRHGPVWRLRWAAVAAELGDYGSAEHHAQGALSEARGQFTRSAEDTENIAVLSLEGWAMLLVEAIKMHLSLGKEWFHSPYRGRLTQLEAWRCSPWSELDFFDLALAGPTPKPTEEVEESSDFDAGSHITYHFGGESLWTKTLPAGQFLRMTEEAGFPPRVGNVGLGMERWRNSARWLEAVSPTRAMATVIRVADKETVEGFFDRGRIASLSESDWRALEAQALHALDGAIAELGERNRGDGDRMVGAAMELLSRVAVRVTDAGTAMRLLGRAVDWYRSDAVKARFDLHEPLSHLFSRLLDAATDVMNSGAILELLSLPVPGAEGFNVAVAERWPEPLAAFTWDQLPVVAPPRDERFDSIIQRLVGIAGTENTVARPRAVLRLAVAYWSGLLTEVESVAFGQALWRFLDDKTGLPRDTHLRHSVFLELPSPDPDLPVVRFKQYCLSGVLTPLCTTTQDADGGRHVSMGFPGDPGSAILEIIQGAKDRQEQGGVQSRRGDSLVDWSTDEAAIFLGMVASWWESEGQQLADATLPIFGQTIQNRRHLVLCLLALVILPRLPADGPHAQLAVRIVEEMQVKDLRVETLLPFLLRFSPQTRDAVEQRLRHGLASSERGGSEEAIEAVYLWVRWWANGLLPAPPADLILNIGTIVSTRRQPALAMAVHCSAGIVRDGPKDEAGLSLLEGAFLESLAVGLQYLQVELRYGSPRSETDHWDIPGLRCSAAELAAALKKFTRLGSAAVQSWLDDAIHDPLPEVRRACRPRA